ncbi:MAG TPA: cyclopropane fatty acyl phospholipid synthase [bacterium]|nr:cyclopropane fatty acyl phospholipid synthase [bacterium]
MVNQYALMLHELLSTAAITINGPARHDIQILNPDFYPRVMKQGHLGLGESYMDGWWECEALDELICRVLLAKLDERVSGDHRVWMLALRARFFNMQSPRRAFQVGEHHYDIGNDLYMAMLDRLMNYSCGYWQNADSLDAAQEAKLDLICRKLNLHDGMSVLDIGCGWGGFARFAAEKYKVNVVGTTVSREQRALGMELCRDLPIEIRLQDYRQTTGRFDRVVSIGMLEHVGYRNYRTFMQVLDRCLATNGIVLLHTIGTDESSTASNPWTQKYIFPNGMLPSLAQLTKAMEGYFVVEDLHNIGPHYDPTLMAWYDNFKRAWPQLADKYGDRFYRMWRFYLLSSAGGFRARHCQVWQLVLTRKGSRQPDCRLR